MPVKCFNSGKELSVVSAVDENLDSQSPIMSL